MLLGQLDPQFDYLPNEVERAYEFVDGFL